MLSLLIRKGNKGRLSELYQTLCIYCVVSYLGQHELRNCKVDSIKDGGLVFICNNLISLEVLEIHDFKQQIRTTLQAEELEDTHA